MALLLILSIAIVDDINEDAVYASKGYSVVRCRVRNNLLFANILINNITYNVIIDTGASHSYLDRKWVSASKIKWNKYADNLGTDLNGTSSSDNYICEVRKAILGKCTMDITSFLSLDLSVINRDFAMSRIEHIDGIIGGDVLRKRGAIILHSKCKMYLK